MRIADLEILKREGGGYRNQYLAGLTASFTTFCAGLHFGWTLPSLSKIMSEEYPFHVTAETASYIVLMGPLGHIIGGIAWSLLIDKIGRRNAILAIAVPQILSFLMIYFSYYGTFLLYLARVAGGVGEGSCLAIVPLYIAEMASPGTRGAISILSNMSYPVAELFINIVGSYLDIHTMAMICLTFPTLFLLSFSMMPESPYYLLMELRDQDAMDSLQILRRSTKVDIELEQLKHDVARQLSEPRNFKCLFTIDSNKKALQFALTSRFSQQFTGIAAFGSYLQILLERSTNFSPIIGASLILVLQIGINILSAFFIDKIGRKPLLTLSSFLTFLILLACGMFFILKDYIGMDLDHVSWLPLIFLMLFTIFFYIGLGCGVFIVISEMFSASIKSKAIAGNSSMYAISMLVTTKYYQYTADNYTLAIPFLTFSAFTLVGCLFFRYFLPETRGKTLETIQQDLKGNSNTFPRSNKRPG